MLSRDDTAAPPGLNGGADKHSVDSRMLFLGEVAHAAVAVEDPLLDIFTQHQPPRPVVVIVVVVVVVVDDDGRATIVLCGV